MFGVSAELSVDVPCIASYFMDNSTDVRPIDLLKTTAYSHNWGSPERDTKGEGDKINSLTTKVMNLRMFL